MNKTRENKMKTNRKVIKEAQKFVDHGPWNTHEFEIVDNFPADYQVWNIGRQNFPHPGYIPLCKADSHYNVDLDSLKALKVKDEKTALDILKRAGRGTITAKNYLDGINESAIPAKTFRQYLKEWTAPYRFVYLDKDGDVVMIDEIDAKEDADAIKKAKIEWEKLVRRGEAGHDDDEEQIKELHVKRRVGDNSFQTIRKIY
jgi:hypothetical protein